MDIARPSMSGGLSNFASSCISSATRLRRLTPISRWASSRPLKTTATFTFAPSSINSRTLRTLEVKSWLPMCGRNRTSLNAVFFWDFLASRSFLE